MAHKREPRRVHVDRYADISQQGQAGASATRGTKRTSKRTRTRNQVRAAAKQRLGCLICGQPESASEHNRKRGHTYAPVTP